MDELVGDREQVIERQAQRPAPRHHHGLLGRGAGGVQPLGAMGAVQGVLARATCAPSARSSYRAGPAPPPAGWMRAVPGGWRGWCGRSCVGSTAWWKLLSNGCLSLALSEPGVREAGRRRLGGQPTMRFPAASSRRTPCGQSVNVASDRVDKLGTTRLGRVAPNLPTLIHPLPTLHRAGPAADRARLRRNNNRIFHKFALHLLLTDGVPLSRHGPANRPRPVLRPGAPRPPVHGTEDNSCGAYNHTGRNNWTLTSEP